MADASKRNATYADLAAVPPHLTAEIIFGALVTHPRPSPKHVTSSGALQIELGTPFQKGRGGPGGWIIVPEPELHLGPHILVPDLAGWRRDSLPQLPRTAFYTVHPDWVCEILLPSTENRDRGDKRRIYSTYNVGHFWLLDPVAQRLEAYVLRDGHYSLHDTYSDDDSVAAPPFDAVPFKLADLWPLPPAPETA
jgi:Uma2 family endonuclease